MTLRFSLVVVVVAVFALAPGNLAARADEGAQTTQETVVVDNQPVQQELFVQVQGNNEGDSEHGANRYRSVISHGSGGGNFSVGGGGVSFATSGAIMLSSEPVVIDTRSMQAEVQLAWEQDLKVMDKLLRDAIGQVGGQPMTPSAMGIRVTLIGGRLPPAYVEDCGVIFGYSVGFPLKSTGRSENQAAEPPKDADSPWEQAKRDLDGRGEGGQETRIVEKLQLQAAAAGAAKPQKFEQGQVDKLIDGILKVLPQAANFRHLAEGESVFVTISGVDDQGKPVRLTLRARKSDIDKAARGDMTVPQFMAHVSSRVG